MSDSRPTIKSDPEAWTIQYLAARADSPWRWADEGEVIAWADGTTIAFRGEIAFILEWLVPHGWPPFGALVWLLAATRGKLPPRTAYEPRFVLPPHPHGEEVDPSQPTLVLFHDRLRSMHDTVEVGLAAIAGLLEEQRTSLKAKAVLAEKIFGGSPDTPAPASYLSKAVEVLRSGLLTDAMLNDPSASPAEPRNEWLALHHGLKDFAAESLELRAKTGLDELPQPSELPQIASVRVRALLEELRTDSDHSGLARLTRDFMAALQLPRRLSQHDEMPIGGFADIANRGNLDRLLLSELAHDDLTLAVRIALNEALYLRREPPAKEPPSTLAVLIDSGVRLWGVPRVLATAIALALVAKNGSHEAPAIFRASRDKLPPVDLLTRQGLIAHLGTLEPHAHPGPALEPFRQVVDKYERAEAVLITHRDALHDAEFQRSLAAAGFEMLYLAVIDREGHFELLRYPRGGAPICQARMNVDDLWPTPTVRSQPLIDPKANPDLPISLSLNPFPLLLTVRGKVQAAIHTRSGGVCVMQDRRLLHWKDTLHGARTVVSGLPRGQTLRLQEQSDGRICVVKAHRGGREISALVYGVGGELLHAHDWHFVQPMLHAEVRGDILVLAGQKTASVRSLVTGEKLAHLDFPFRLISFSGRYLHAGNGNWYTLMWDGLQLRLEPLTFVFHDVESRSPTLLAFDRRGQEGAWRLSTAGVIYSPEGVNVLTLGKVCYSAQVSEDGHRLTVYEYPGGLRRFVDLPNLGHHAIHRGAHREVWDWPHSRPPLPSFSIRVRFNQIAIDNDATLHLRERGGVWRTLLPTDDGFKLVLHAVPGHLHAVPFEPLRLLARRGYSLKVARWPDGRCAWLDDRGMLHLRCGNRSLPELTIALSDPLAMWASDGLWIGPSFFVGDQRAGTTEEFLERLGNFCRPAPLFPGIEA